MQSRHNNYAVIVPFRCPLHLPEVAAIERSFFKPALTRKEIRQLGKGPNSSVVVAVQKTSSLVRRVLGCAICERHYEHEFCEIYSLAVKKEFQGRGIGSQLLQAICDQNTAIVEMKWIVMAVNERCLSQLQWLRKKEFLVDTREICHEYFDDGDDLLISKLPINLDLHSYNRLTEYS